MGNPGNHGQPGDWQHQPPYGQGDDEPAKPYGQPPYGEPGEDTPRPGGSPYRSLDDELYTALSDPSSPYSGDPEESTSSSSTFGNPLTSSAGPYGDYPSAPETSATNMWGDSAVAGGEPFTGPTTSNQAFGSPSFGPETGTSGMFGGASEPVDATEASMFGGALPAGRDDDRGSDGNPPPIGYERGRGYSGPSQPKRRRKLPIILVAAAVAGGFALVGGGIAYSLRDGSGSGPNPKAGPGGPGAAKPTTPATPDPQALAQNIRSRKVDPKPLTLPEVFNQTKFSEGGGSYIMTKRRADRDCDDAVTGATLQTALRKARCSQLLRATFTTTGGKLVGTIGIANLSTEKSARVAARAARGGRNYVEPLRGSGNTSKLGRSGSSAVGTADVRGHYLILSWVQYPSGKKIAKKHYPAITRFERNVIVGCKLGTALGHRMVNRRPAPTAQN